jgi:multiple sugar transport system permease protein
MSATSRSHVDSMPRAGVVDRSATRRGWGVNSTGLVAAAPFLLPALVALILLRLWPMAEAVISSLSVGPLGGTATRFGLDNYVFLLTSPDAAMTLRATLLFSLVTNPLQVATALGLALLLSQNLPWVGLWRTVIFLPIAVPQAVAAVVWGVAFRPDGPLNAALVRTGLPPQAFLTSPDQALPSLIALVSWVGVGYWMMFLIAGLLDIPRTYYEAAAVDGASAWQRFRHITLPLLRRPLLFVLVADTVANFLVFAPVQILTQGGPQGATHLVMFDIYDQAYRVGDLRLANAETVLLVMVVLAIVTVQFRLLGRGEGRA